jgi:hypothetical protein
VHLDQADVLAEKYVQPCGNEVVVKETVKNRSWLVPDSRSSQAKRTMFKPSKCV